MADTKEFDVEQIKGSQFMDRQDRQYFERHGAAMSGQAEALAEQYDIDPKEMNDTFDTLMESLICNWKEYIVNGAPLKCSMQAEEGTEQTLFYQGNEITSKPVLTAGMSALQLPEERPEDARGFVFANISDTSGGLRDELVKEEGRLNITSFGNCKRIDEENITEIEEMLDGVCRALMNRYEYTGVTEEEMLSGILQALKQNMGTCFCCMVLNPEWENLPTEYDYVDNTFREEPMMSGIDRVLFADSYMKFNGREGINMMSMLFCRYGGGTISAKESGQGQCSMGLSIRDMLWRDLKSMGYGDIAVAAIMGNISWESGGYIIDITQNGGKAETKDVGIGLCQWTYEPRKQGLFKLADELGATWDTYEVQIRYIEYELLEGYDFRSVRPEIMNQYSDVDIATEYFMLEFENPDKDKLHLEERKEEARKVLKDYCE